MENNNNNNINLNQNIIEQLKQETVCPLNQITASPLNQETVNSTNNPPINPLNQPISPENQEKIEFLNQALSSLNLEFNKQTETLSKTEKNEDEIDNNKDKNSKKNKKKRNKKKKKQEKEEEKEEEKKKEINLIDKFLGEIKYLKDELKNLEKTYYTIKLNNYNGLKKRSEELEEKIKKINILYESEKLNNLKNQIKDMINFVLKEHKSKNNLKKESEKISEVLNVNETIKQFKNPQTTTSGKKLTNNEFYEQLKELRHEIETLFEIAHGTIESQKNINKACEKAFEATCISNSMELWQNLTFIIPMAKDSIEEAKKIVNSDLAVIPKICECFKEYIDCLEKIVK